MLTILDGTSSAQRNLDAGFIVPADIDIEFGDGLLHRGSSPLTRVEELDLEPPEGIPPSYNRGDK